jgi:hypothetical protein
MSRSLSFRNHGVWGPGWLVMMRCVCSAFIFHQQRLRPLNHTQITHRCGLSLFEQPLLSFMAHCTVNSQGECVYSRARARVCARVRARAPCVQGGGRRGGALVHPFPSPSAAPVQVGARRAMCVLCEKREEREKRGGSFSCFSSGYTLTVRLSGCAVGLH